MSDTTVKSNRPNIKPIIPGENLRDAEKIARMQVKIEKSVTPPQKFDWILTRLPTGNKIKELKTQLREKQLHTASEAAARSPSGPR
jgi:lipoic acid synthetase